MFGFRERLTGVEEILDRSDVDPGLRRDVLQQLPVVNRWLGGKRALCREFRRVIRGLETQEVFVLDIGCGVGDLPAALATEGTVRGHRVFAAGLDLHTEVLREAQLRGITAVRGNALRLPFRDRSFDVVTASMVFHHFEGEALEELLLECCRVARHALIVNELYRHPVAWLGWLAWSSVFVGGAVIRYDGAVSVRKGFRRGDLVALVRRAPDFRWEIRRHLGFRICLTGIRNVAHSDAEDHAPDNWPSSSGGTSDDVPVRSSL